MSSPPASASALLRPWRQFLDLTTLSFPISLSEATDRLAVNLRYFSPNYLLLTLIIFLLSLLPHPLFLILFILLSCSWAYLYLLRNESFELFNFTIEDKPMLVFLSVVTLVTVFWAKAWSNVVVSVAIGAVISVIHAVIKAPEEGDSSPYGTLLSDVDGGRGEYVSV